MGKKNNYKGISLYNAELAQARRDRHARLAAQLSEYGYKVELWEESLLHRKVLYIVSYAVPVAEWWTAPHKRNPFSRTYWTHRQTEQFRRDFDRIAAECDAAMEGFYHEHRSLFLDLTAKANESTTLAGITLCYCCAGDKQRRELNTVEPGGTFAAYLSSDRNYITTWSGGILATVRWLQQSRAGYTGKRLYFDAVTPTGILFRGQAQDGGMYCTIRRSKKQKVANQ